MSDQRPAPGLTGIGKPFRLPFSVAMRVAGTSIRVRLSRSLVTVSSVVLAVTFLLAVAGESVAVRAVHEQWRTDTQAQRAARAVRAALDRPREDLELLQLIAGVTSGNALAATSARSAVRLQQWISELKPAYRYVLVRDASLDTFVAHIDAPGRREHLLACAQGFRGVLLELSAAELDQLVAQAGALRAGVDELRRSDLARIAAIQSAGGSDAVLSAWADSIVASGAPSASIAALVPIAQIAPELPMMVIAQQVQRDVRRSHAAAALAEAQRREPPRKNVVLPDLAAVLAGAGSATAQRAVTAAVADIPAMRRDLEQRSASERTAAQLAALGGDPQSMGSRTFWLIVLSLLVCVVGIVNTMMMAVTERFREIATMKCLGAPDGFILRIFLVEATALGAVGSCIGLLIGVALVMAQAGWRFGAAFWSAFPAGELALTGVAAVGTGLLLAIIGALLPAITASRMHPIEAMRVDA